MSENFPTRPDLFKFPETNKASEFELAKTTIAPHFDTSDTQILPKKDGSEPLPATQILPHKEGRTPRYEELPTDTITDDVVQTPETNSSDELTIGEVLMTEQGQHFLVQDKLGEGSMGGVYRVKNQDTLTTHALKVVLPDRRGMDEMNVRFEKEMKMLAKINNPYILSAYEKVHLDIHGQRVTGFLTDFVEGSSLFDKMKKESKPTLEQSVTMMAQMAFALTTLETMGIVHRDLKPENIFLEQTDQGKPHVRIGDFGVATFTSEPKIDPKTQEDPYQDLRDSKITTAGLVLGTPLYMSPEAMQGKKIDHRSDLYSLGAVMYEMMAGHRVFEGENMSEISLKHLTEKPKSFAQQGIKNIPDWLEQIIFTLLQKNPNNRYASSTDLFMAVKEGVKKDFPQLLREEPFMHDLQTTLPLAA